MARSFEAASSQWATVSSSPVSTVPCTLACWMRKDSNQTGYPAYLMAIGRSIDDNDELALRISSSSPHKIVATSRQADSSITTETASGTSTGTWYHAAAVFASATSRTAYLNATGTSGTDSSTPTSLDQIAIGALYRATSVGLSFDGAIAHAGIWNVALSATEVASLYNNGIGADPRSVRPDALVAYWPLLNNDGDQDYWGNYHLTASGSPTYAQHPPVLMRSRPKYVVLGSAAPTVGEVTITGTRTIGETITANATPTPGDATLTYQWEKSATGSGSGTDISGETASTLALTYADFGDILDTAAYVRCGVVATKDAVPSVETFSSWLEVSAGGAASVGSPFVSSSIR